jgi:hypothetical protein
MKQFATAMRNYDRHVPDWDLPADLTSYPLRPRLT